MPLYEERYNNTSEFISYFRELEEKGEYYEPLLVMSYHGLNRNGVMSIDKLRNLTKEDVLKMRNMGERCWNCIETVQNMLPKKVKVRNI